MMKNNEIYLVVFLLLSLIPQLNAADLIVMPPTMESIPMQLANNPDTSLVFVSGSVKKIQSSNDQKIAAENITVRFWQPQNPGAYITATTNTQGIYRIGLSEGVWRGEACGSGTSFYPSAWDVKIQDNTLISLNAAQNKSIKIDVITPSNVMFQNSSVTMTGQGFGCNGSLIFTYSNSVSICNETSDVQYNRQSIKVSNFSFRTDNQLRFIMPQLDSNRGVQKHIASVRYEQGSNRSAGINIGEGILASQANNSAVCDQGYIKGTVNTASTMTTRNIISEASKVRVFNVLAGAVINDGVGKEQLGAGGYNPRIQETDIGIEMSIKVKGISKDTIENLTIENLSREIKQ